MLSHQLLRDDGILILEPQGPLQVADFDALNLEINPYLEKEGRLRGLLIDAAEFPGWESFAALLSHLRFIRDHHRLIAKVAAVSDNKFLSIAPRVASHFVKAEVRHFPSHDRDAALAWLREE